MNRGLLRGAGIAATLSCLGAPQTQALELFSGASSAAKAYSGMISKAYVARGPRGGVHRGGAHHGVYRGPDGGVYRAPHGGVYRGGVYGVRPGYGYHGGDYGGWARPGWYGRGPGGAIAAGAAVSVIGAAAAASYAGAPPAPGLCWYYTDPSRTQGFWGAFQ
jgi:hypothetical protein